MKDKYKYYVTPCKLELDLASCLSFYSSGTSSKTRNMNMNMNKPSLTYLTFFYILTFTFIFPTQCSRTKMIPFEGEDFVTQVCKKTPFFDLCMTILYPDERSYGADTKGLAKIVMEKDLNVAKEILAQARALAHDGSKLRELRAKCAKCVEEFHKIVFDLIPGATKMVDVGDIRGSIERLHSAAELAKACDDQFKGEGGSPIVNCSVHDISIVAVSILELVLSWVLS